MSSINIYRLLLYTSELAEFTGEQLRITITAQFPNIPLLHNHDGKGCIYRYPRMQYKIINNIPQIVAIGEGIDLLKFLQQKLIELRINSKTYKIIARETIEKKDKFAISNEDKTYTFLTEWIALNSKNYDRFMRMGNRRERIKLLKKFV